MFNKAVQILLVSFLVLAIFPKTFYEVKAQEGCVIDGEEFSESECQEMYKTARERVSAIDKEIKEAQDDQQEKEALAEKYEKQAADMQDDIDTLRREIEDLKVKIDQLQYQISVNEQKVEELNQRVKNRMVATQKSMHFNGYLEFILGSKSFSDMLRRIYGVKAILSKDKSDRSEYINTINQLTVDKEELNKSKEQLDANYTELLAKQEELKAMEEYYLEQVAIIQANIDEMNNERDNEYSSFNDIAAALRDAQITVSDGFVAVVHNSWIAQTVWNYSPDFLDGNWHLGVDYSANRYTEIHAPAAGVIVRANMGCEDVNKTRTYDACGVPLLGGGNQVYMMCEVDGVVYGFIFMHLNQINVEEGDFLLQDDVIGLVGSSGKSTGPHCHVEMYELGNGTLEEYLKMSWNATWSCGRGSVAYSNRCYNDSDGSRRQEAPCILNPEWYLPEG